MTINTKPHEEESTVTNKVFVVFIIGIFLFIGYKTMHVGGSCLDDLALNIKTCKPYKCQLEIHPYAKTEDKADIQGYKNGKCVYVVDTGFVRTTCHFPSSMLDELSEEFAQKSRAKKFGTIKRTRMNFYFDKRTGRKIEFPEILIDGTWERYRYVLRDALRTGECSAFDRKTNKKIVNP